MIQDPAALGLVGKPNVVGVSYSVSAADLVAAIKLITPRAVKIGVMQGSETVARQVQELKAAASTQLLVEERSLKSSREVPRLWRELIEQPVSVDALWLTPDPSLLDPATRRFVFSEALRAQKPVYTSLPSLLSEGALASVSADPASVGELAADLVERLAGGRVAKKDRLLTPRAELTVNQKVAEQLKIELSKEALAVVKVF
jgi:ABC-type uncharacterized transport system substrate-binding protein